MVVVLIGWYALDRGGWILWKGVRECIVYVSLFCALWCQRLSARPK